MGHLSEDELAAGLDEVRKAPRDEGRVELLVLRPSVGERRTPESLDIDLLWGALGDNWLVRGSKSTPDGSANPEAQVTIMNARMSDLLAGGDPSRWALAGDQIYADLDLGTENLPPGARIRLGAAVLEISAKPHTGCTKFLARFGRDAMALVNSPVGRDLRLRGANCKVVSPGTIRVGDIVTKELSP